MTSTESFTLAVAFLGVITSVTAAYLAYRVSRQSQRAESQREVGRLYEKMMDFRTEHPEVMALSRQWTEACFARVYGQKSAQDREWALYYTYCELCAAFANAVLYARDAGLMDRTAFERQYRSLVKLILTEHYPYLSTILHGKYVSSYILNFLDEMSRSGWDWSIMHADLSPDPQSKQRPRRNVGLSR